MEHTWKCETPVQPLAVAGGGVGGEWVGGGGGVGGGVAGVAVQ